MKLLYFSTVNWNWIKQRPQFMAYYLSKNGIEVDYFSLTPLLKQRIRKVDPKSDNLNINDIYVIPFANKVKKIEDINICRVKKLLNKNKYDSIVLTHPFHFSYVTDEMREHAKIIYECMDNMPFFYDNDIRNKVIIKEKELCMSADLIITSSNYLKNRIILDYKIDDNKINVIKNAVDISFCDKSNNNDLKLQHPNLMYIGTVSHWFDYSTINEFAKNNPEITIYIIGPIDNKLLRYLTKHRNVKLVGPIRHDLVKTYIYHADTMIIPFIVNDIIKGVDPVKMYEYLSLNKMIVSSFWEELEAYKSNKNVYFYNDYNEFDNIIKATIINNKSNSIVNTDFINKNNWDKRVKEYIQLI